MVCLHEATPTPYSNQKSKASKKRQARKDKQEQNKQEHNKQEVKRTLIHGARSRSLSSTPSCSITANKKVSIGTPLPVSSSLILFSVFLRLANSAASCGGCQCKSVVYCVN